jgi:hypothetical protein
MEGGNTDKRSYKLLEEGKHFIKILRKYCEDLRFNCYFNL